MIGSPNIAKIGALLGDNTRAQMLSTLMHGKALTASELAADAGVTAQTATFHLNKLEAGGLLLLRKQGRHKYFTLANADIASLLETLMGLTSANETPIIRTGPRDEALRNARVCYNHLAGGKGIQLYDSLFSQKFLSNKHSNLMLTRKGKLFMSDFGIDLDALHSSRTPLCRECLDWSERRSHLSGSLGRALYSKFESLKWVRRDANTRVVKFTNKGTREFDSIFYS